MRKFKRKNIVGNEKSAASQNVTQQQIVTNYSAGVIVDTIYKVVMPVKCTIKSIIIVIGEIKGMENPSLGVEINGLPAGSITVGEGRNIINNKFKLKAGDMIALTTMQKLYEVSLSYIIEY